MFNDTVDVVVFPTVRDHGRDVPDFAADPVDSTPLVGVDVQPGASVELVAQRRDATVIRWTVWVPTEVIPTGLVLHDNAVVRFRGRLYEVDGDPMAWVNGSPLDHLVLLLKGWTH